MSTAFIKPSVPIDTRSFASELDFENLEQQSTYFQEYEIDNTTEKEIVPDVFTECEVVNDDFE